MAAEVMEVKGRIALIVSPEELLAVEHLPREERLAEIAWMRERKTLEHIKDRTVLEQIGIYFKRGFKVRTEWDRRLLEQRKN